jgi:leader peptidase (prepilin peptidase)/N-methyltransferase
MIDFDFFINNPAITYLLTGIFSLLLGSFLNVVIHRLPIMMEEDFNEAMEFYSLPEDQRESVVLNDNDRKRTTLCRPSSTCPSCDHKIRWFENIPVFSWIFLRGKCSACKSSISIQYPLIELITAIAPVAVLYFGGITQAGFGFIVFTYAIIVLSAIDFKHQLLPDSITQPLLWIGLILSVTGFGFVDIENAIFGAVSGYLSLWALYWVFRLFTKKEGMGFGDFKLYAAIGAWGGYAILPMVGVIAGILGLVVAIVMKLSGSFPKDQRIAFGPYLAVAGWIMIFTNYVMTQVVF